MFITQLCVLLLTLSAARMSVVLRRCLAIINNTQLGHHLNNNAKVQRSFIKQYIYSNNKYTCHGSYVCCYVMRVCIDMQRSSKFEWLLGATVVVRPERTRELPTYRLLYADQATMISRTLEKTFMKHPTNVLCVAAVYIVDTHVGLTSSCL